MPAHPRPAARTPVGLAALLLITSSIALAHPAAARAWDENAYSSASERQLVSLTNRSRASAGRT
jgi:hypothetical protein